MILKDHSPEISTKLLAWFAENRRDLPWRRTYLPYHIWISEIMLQQTQMERGVTCFNRWIERFHDIQSIADADEDEVLMLWEGLGYYNRARNIHRTAKILANDFHGTLPSDYHTLLKLPGIGNYTANAIMSLAFNKDYPIVDANVERVFARLFDIGSPIKEKKTHALIWKKAAALIPKGQARNFNQALMELGALICLPKNPTCPACPIREDCLANHRGIVAERPLPGNGKKIIPIEMATGILVHKKRIFIQKRLSNDIWANLWEFPGGRLKEGETPEEALVREFYEETEFAVGGLRLIQSVKHSYTVYRVTLHAYLCSLTSGSGQPILHAAQESRWVRPRELHDYPFPSVHRKLINSLLDQGIVS